ncbi:MAG: hypothetical protein PHR78_06480 [Eubacteriales bacterium]|nr:hypothetical protein [Eubacteriales bacterium]
MKNYKDDKKTMTEFTELKNEQGGCPDRPGQMDCGSCPGCSGQRKRYSTVYYVIPALVIVVLALILKYFGII